MTLLSFAVRVSQLKRAFQVSLSLALAASVSLLAAAAEAAEPTAPAAPAGSAESRDVSPRAAPPPETIAPSPSSTSGSAAPTAAGAPMVALVAPPTSPTSPTVPAPVTPAGPAGGTVLQVGPPAPSATVEGGATKPAMPVQAVRPSIRVTTWDLNLDAGYGAVIDTPENRPSWFLRTRAGVLHAHDDWFYSAGLTYDIVKVFRVGGYDATNFGLQLEALHVQYGVWGQVGGLVDFTGHGGVTAAVGWSLFGVEYQARTYEDLGPVMAVYGKIRIPVSIIYHAVKKDL